MQMAYQRLDGQMGSLEKQKRIDQFNAPDSPLFAFLLSTRAGGVGINLATADTVIILDPDWNPHQDLQAIARAHRIGQKKKVLCFQLMTRASVEEKIIQMGRKKMALDHVVVEQLDADDADDHDVESILKFGAAELFKDDNADQDIRYDENSIEKLLDRSQVENTRTNTDDDSAEAQFSFARVWANDKGTLQNDLDTPEEEVLPDPGVWDKILKERQAAAAVEALARAEAMGRGRRARGVGSAPINTQQPLMRVQNVDYVTEQDAPENASVVGEDAFEDNRGMLSPMTKADKRKMRRNNSESDTDFQAETDEESEPEPGVEVAVNPIDAQKELGNDQRRSTVIPTNTKLNKQNGAVVSTSKLSSNTAKFPAVTLPVQAHPQTVVRPTNSDTRVALTQFKPSKVPSLAAPGTDLVDLTGTPSPRAGTKLPFALKPFKRAHLPVRNPLEQSYANPGQRVCPACRKVHPHGACELKVAGVEHCGLCGLAHYGHARTCPHINSETQVREMLLALKNSPEKKELVDAAVKYLRGVKGSLVQTKKWKETRAQQKALEQNSLPNPVPPPSGIGHPPKHKQNGPTPHVAPAGASNGMALAASQFTNDQLHRNAVDRQRMLQMQALGRLNETRMENALRGFLGT
jgi:chromodomain-helicase-DNA-binding protein 4